MFGAILKVTNSSFKKGMTFCRSIYVKKVMKLLAFIFEQPSYKVHSTLRNKIFKFCNCYYLNKKQTNKKNTSLSIYLFMLCLCSRPSPCHYVNVYMM